MRRLILRLIQVYQMISRRLPPVCRFYPSCSHYMHDAVGHYGMIQGLRLGLWRMIRCHPFHAGGYDPIPALLKSPKTREV